MWLLAAAVASLAVVVVALVQSSGQRNATAVASVLLSVLSVALSWALVNSVYAFKYARLYYLDEPDIGGIDFKQEDAPTYSDFAYMAFTVGMSFAVSETEPTGARIRRVAPGHAAALLRVRHGSPGGGYQLGHQSRSVTGRHPSDSPTSVRLLRAGDAAFSSLVVGSPQPGQPVPEARDLPSEEGSMTEYRRAGVPGPADASALHASFC